MTSVLSNLILVALIILRYFMGFLEAFPISDVIDGYLRFWFPFLSYLLILCVFWVNIGNTEETNIDIISFSIILILSLYFSVLYLPYVIGFLLFLLVVHLVIAYKLGNLTFQNVSNIGKKSSITILILGILFSLIAFSGDTLSEISGYLSSAQFPGVVFEEILFRGFLWRFLEKKGFKPIYAMLISSSLFWFAHFNLLVDTSLSFWITLPVVSFGLGYQFFRTRSLSSSILTHFVYNVFISFMKS
jgi:membrane protease YdiL (CAAX protease family)